MRWATVGQSSGTMKISHWDRRRSSMARLDHDPGRGTRSSCYGTGVYRDGLGGESAPGYSVDWIANFYRVARLFPLLGKDIWSNPRLKKMADVGLDLTVAGIHCPSIGDTGSISGAGRLGWSALDPADRPLRAHRERPFRPGASKQMGAQPGQSLGTAPVRSPQR